MICPLPSEEKLEDILLLGELALDGTVRPVPAYYRPNVP
jgi:predicted ATPase with chaperone activity